MGKIGKLMMLAGVGFAIIGLPAVFIIAEIFSLIILKPLWVIVAWLLGSPALIVVGSVLSKKKGKSTIKALVVGVVLAVIMIPAGGIVIIAIVNVFSYN